MNETGLAGAIVALFELIFYLLDEVHDAMMHRAKWLFTGDRTSKRLMR